MTSDTGKNRKLTYRKAIRAVIREAMHRDDRVFLWGEDVGRYGGCFAVTKGCSQNSVRRESAILLCRNRPLSERQPRRREQEKGLDLIKGDIFYATAARLGVE